MKNVKLMVMTAAAALMLAPSIAAAGVQDTAIDKFGRPIMDARGNCVLTKWQVQHNACGMAISKEARTVYFAFNKYSIKASEKSKLDSLIKVLKSTKDVASVDIYGHADAIGDNGYNKILSRKRAYAVRDYLAKNGGIKTRNVEVKALGESQPVTKCDKKLPRNEMIACLARDRRVEIELNYAR